MILKTLDGQNYFLYSVESDGNMYRILSRSSPSLLMETSFRDNFFLNKKVNLFVCPLQSYCCFCFNSRMKLPKEILTNSYWRMRIKLLNQTIFHMNEEMTFCQNLWFDHFQTRTISTGDISLHQKITWSKASFSGL